MVTVSQIVTQLINQRPYLAEAISDGIVNLSSLARLLKTEIEEVLQKEVQNGAIVMALQRYSPQIHSITTTKFRQAIKNIGDIILRSELAEFTYKNSDTLFSKQINLFNEIAAERGFFYTFVQGVFESTFVISQALQKQFEEIFCNEYLVAHASNLSSITLKLPLENTELPGFYYFILRQIAWNGINIVEVISTANEFTIVVQENDVERAFSVIKSLKK